MPRLAGSLAEFLSAGGELLVVDTGSDDETVRVARAAGGRVEEAGDRFHSILTDEEAAAIEAAFAREGEGPLVRPGEALFDFGRARQFAAELASNDLVWHIDAGDVVLSADLDFLDAEVRSGRAGSFDYVLRVGSSSLRICRFSDRRDSFWRGRVHEALEGTGRQATRRRVHCNEQQLSVRHLKGGGRRRNYLAGLALDAIEFPSSPRWKHYLGRELYYGSRYRSAIPLLLEHSLMKDAWEAETSESLCLAGDCLARLDRSDEAADAYLRAHRADPSRRQPLLKLASLYQGRGDFERSVAFALAALRVPHTSAFVEPDENYTCGPHAILYWSLFWLGRREEARLHWEACRRMAPENREFEQDGRLFGSPL